MDMESGEHERQPLIEESEVEPIHHKLGKNCGEKTRKIFCCCISKYRRSYDLNNNEISAFRSYQRQFGCTFDENVQSHARNLEDLKATLAQKFEISNLWRDFGFQVFLLI